MKKITYILSALIFASCSMTGIDDKSTACDNVVFLAEFERGEGTKTYLNEDGLMRWTQDDRVSIFAGKTYNQQFVFDGKTGANGGSFSQVGNPSFISGSKLTANYAIYPYNEDNMISESGIFKVSLPGTQAYAENSFGLKSNTMVAVTEDSDDNFLLFKNVCGYLKVSLYGDVVFKSVTLSGNNGEKIAGDAHISASFNSVPSVSMGSSASRTITIDCGDGVRPGLSESSATSFYFVVPPVDFSAGITLSAIDVEGKEYSMATTKRIYVERNKISKMSPLRFDGVYEGKLTLVDCEMNSGKKVINYPSIYDLDGDFAASGIGTLKYSVSPQFFKEVDYSAYIWDVVSASNMVSIDRPYPKEKEGYITFYSKLSGEPAGTIPGPPSDYFFIRGIDVFGKVAVVSDTAYVTSTRVNDIKIAHRDFDYPEMSYMDVIRPYRTEPIDITEPCDGELYNGVASPVLVYNQTLDLKWYVGDICTDIGCTLEGLGIDPEYMFYLSNEKGEKGRDGDRIPYYATDGRTNQNNFVTLAQDGIMMVDEMFVKNRRAAINRTPLVCVEAVVNEHIIARAYIKVQIVDDPAPQ